MSSCPTFGNGGPSGIAEALRVVDCMSGEAASFAFGRLFGSDAVLGQALTAALTLPRCGSATPVRKSTWSM